MDTRRKAVVCDLDGTLALFKHLGHRNPFQEERCAKDAVNLPVKLALEAFRKANCWAVVLSTARRDKFRQETIDWLDRHRVQFDALFMRRFGDNRQDAIVKAELFRDHINPQFDVQLWLDDRDQVVEVLRWLGVPVWQVADGDF